MADSNDSKTSPITDMQAVKTPDKVDDAKFYRVTLQFGQSRSWRKLSGLPRVKKLGLEPNTYEYIHNPRIHKNFGPIEGHVVNGLIQEHTDWLVAYKARSEKTSHGHLDNQLLVLDIKETSEIPDKIKKATQGSVDVIAVIESIVNRVVTGKSAPSKTAS